MSWRLMCRVSYHLSSGPAQGRHWVLPEPRGTHGTHGYPGGVISPPAPPPPQSGGMRVGALPAAWQLCHRARPTSCPCPGWPWHCQCRCKSSLASTDWSPSHPWCHREQSWAVPVINQTPLHHLSFGPSALSPSVPRELQPKLKSRECCCSQGLSTGAALSTLGLFPPSEGIVGLILSHCWS